MQYKCSLRWIREGGSLEGRIPCIYIQGNGASCAKKVGTGLARQRSLGSAVFDGGVFPGTRRGVWYRESFQGSLRGWKRGGMEWNGVERSARRVRWCRGDRGDRRLIMQFQDCHYPRPPNSLRRFYLFCFYVSLARFFSSFFPLSLSHPSPSPGRMRTNEF